MKLGASYFGSRVLRHVRADMEKMLYEGCNFVVHTMSEQDVAYYPETMVDIVRASRELGLEVFLDPWGVGRVFGGEAFSNFVTSYPTDCEQMTMPEGNLRIGKACLNSKTFRGFMVDWIELAARSGAEGAFWDEPHLYYAELMPLFGKRRELWACSCPTCKALFLSKYGYEMTAEFSKDVMEFRQRTILDFIEFLSVKAASKGLKNALCLLPFHEPKYGVYNWHEALKIKHLDIFGSDPYWLCFNREVKEFVGQVSRQVVGLCRRYHKEPQIWIQSFRIPHGKEEELAAAIEAAYGEGVRNLATWCFEGGACMSYLRSDRPDVVWAKITGKFRELRARNS